MGVAWLKKGDEAKKLEEQAKQDAIDRQNQMGKLWRFYLDKGETGEITFVDGALDPKYNALNPDRFFEHNLQIAGKWGNTFVCPEKTNPGSGEKCPICAGGDKPSLVALFTIIDHRPYTTKKGVTIPFGRKLFVANPTVFEQLNTMAQALKGTGLAGRRFSVSRSNSPTSSRTGTTFTPLDKEPVEVLKAKYIRKFERKLKDSDKTEMVTENCFTVADYEKEIEFFTSAQLAAKGFGSGAPNAGGHSAPSQAEGSVTENQPAENFEDLL